MAASKKTEVAAENIVNADTIGSRDPNSPDQAYVAKQAMTQSLAQNGASGGVKSVVLERNPAFVPAFSPDSPFADENGLVNAPNVNLDEEMLNLKVAEQAYKANAQVIKTSSDMQNALLDALDETA